MVQERTLTHDAPVTVGSGKRAARSSTPEELSRRNHGAAVATVLLVQMVAAGYLITHSYFFAEDFTFLVLYQDTPLSAELLKTPIFGHLVPGFILVQKYFGAWFGTNWGLAALATLAVQLGGTVAFARMLLALVGRRTWWTVWLTAAFGLSVVVLNTSPWWAATWTMQITMVFAVSAWGCALRYDRTRRRRHLVALAVVFILSVSFFEKSIATSAYLGLFVLMVGTRDHEPLASRFRHALRLGPVWAILAAVSVADLAVYFSGSYLEASGEPASLALTGEYLARSLPEGVFPSLIGAVNPISLIPGPAGVTFVVATAVVLSVVVWTCLRSPLARRAWVWYFLVTLLSQGLVARGRVGVVGVETTVQNLRYQGDAVYLFLIALAVAVPAAVHGSAFLVRRRVMTAALVAPLLALPLWVQSVHALSENSAGRASRDYFEQLRTGDLPDGTFLDLPVPGWVVPTQMYPWNMAGRIYPEVRPGAEVTDDPEGALWIRPDGSVGPVQLSDATTPTDREVCARVGESPVAIMTAPEAERPAGDPLLLALSYHIQGSSSVQLSVGRNKVYKDVRGTGELFDLTGTGDLAAFIAPTTWRVVYVAVAKGDPVCVTSVRLATPFG